MAKYNLTNKYQEIAELEGGIQNNSVLYPILIAASATWPDANTPYVTIQSDEIQNFKAAENEKVYLRLFTNDDSAQFEVSVVTFIPEQLQNCLQTLDESLVAVISPKGISSNVVGANVINTGGNVIEGDGISFVKTEDGFGIGKAYENFEKKAVDAYGQTYRKDGYYEFDNLQENVQMLGGIPNLTNGIYYISMTVYEGRGYLGIRDPYVYCNYTRNTEIVKSSPETGEIELKVTISDVPQGQGAIFYIKPFGYGCPEIQGADVSISNVSFTPTSNKVPFVPHSFRGGELKIDKKWSVKNNSMILEVEGISSSGNTYFGKTLDGAYYIRNSESVDIADKYFAIISDVFKKVIDENGVEYNLYLDTGVPNVRETLELNFVYSWAYNTLYNFFDFKKILTEEESREILAILKSRNYVLPPNMQGTILPVEGMVRRNDEYGVLNDTVKTDTNRDLWYVDKPALYTVVNSVTATESNVIVQDDLSIAGTGMEDVSGRLRVTSDSYVRKVK